MAHLVKQVFKGALGAPQGLTGIDSERLSRERRAQLQRLSKQIVQVRRELSRIESEGIALRARRDEVLAEGKAVFIVGTRIAQRSTVVLTQLAYLEGCVRRREAVVNGMMAVLDDHPASYDLVGLAQVRSEYSLRQTEVAPLRDEATIAEASFAKLDQEARSLAVQLKYLAVQRQSAR